MRVTFDSNVYRRVVAPDMFPNDPTKPQIEKIHQHLNNHHISGFLSETVATLEGVTRSNRCSYFSSLKLKVEFNEIENPDGTILLETRAGPDNSQHPGLPEILENWLNDALRLGFMFMRAPRIGTPRPNFLALNIILSKTARNSRSGGKTDFRGSSGKSNISARVNQLSSPSAHASTEGLESPALGSNLLINP